MKITRTFEIADITPEELAQVFAGMYADEQARFFAAIKPIAAQWPGAGWCQQSHGIARNLNADGRFVIDTLVAHIRDDKA